MTTIPLHQLKNRASSGLEMKCFDDKNVPKDVEALGVHRDDHYLFFLLGKGTASLMIDFKQLHFEGSCLYYILPGQVHHRIVSNVEFGWYVAVDTALVPPSYRDVFEGNLLTQEPVKLNANQFEQCIRLVTLLYDKHTQSQTDVFQLPVTHSLLQAFVGTAAGFYNEKTAVNIRASRPVELAREFKKLLTQHIITNKSPSAYAELLNVTEGYLNEVMKKTTGYSVSQLIVHEVMLEAKRLLYYTKLNVKEIAHSLGYLDHTYFSRLFKNSEGISPLSFRADYLK